MWLKCSCHKLKTPTCHKGSKGPLRTHLENCTVTPSDDIISIIGRTSWGDGCFFTLEALFIKELTAVLNTKNEYRSRGLALKF